MSIPKDPVMLLSFVNMQLRDFYPSLEELCKALMVDEDGINSTLNNIDYFYDKKANQFV